MENSKKEQTIKKQAGILKYLVISLIILFMILAYLVLKTNLENLTTPDSVKTPLNFFKNTLIILISFFITYFFIKITKKIIRKYLEKIGRSKKNIKLFLGIYEFLVWIIIISLTLSLIFKEVGSLITSIGLVGFGLTLALQKPILNFVGWITVIFSKTYNIGDIVSIGNTFGKVYDIRVMYTSLGELNADGDSTGRSISLPNEFIFSNPIINFSKGTDYIWDTIVLNLTYKSNWKKAIKITEKVVTEYYEKNIKKRLHDLAGEGVKKDEDVTVRFSITERGFLIKARYMVDFNVSNDVKREISEMLLKELKSKDIILGKNENIL